MQAGNRPDPKRLNDPAEAGFTYIAVLVAMVILSLATQSVVHVVAQQAQRDREAELLRIGQLYQQAIAAGHATWTICWATNAWCPCNVTFVKLIPTLSPDPLIGVW
jgi:type II secretory pathway pseudopilin PulG